MFSSIAGSGTVVLWLLIGVIGLGEEAGMGRRQI
jgi:hypothetical protein